MKIHKQSVLRNAVVLGSAAAAAMVGDASAANITSINAYPTLGAAPFMGNTGTTFGVRVGAAGGTIAAADEVKLFFVSASKQVLRSATMTVPAATPQSGLFTYTVSASDIAGATHVVVAYKDTNGDVLNGYGAYGYVRTTNAQDGQKHTDGGGAPAANYASTAEVVAEAISPTGADAGGLIPINTAYTALTRVRVYGEAADGVGSTYGTIEFNADVYKVTNATTAPATAISTANGGAGDISFRHTTATALAVVGTIGAQAGTAGTFVLGPVAASAVAGTTTLCYNYQDLSDGSGTTAGLATMGASTAVCTDIPAASAAYSFADPAIASGTNKVAVALPTGAGTSTADKLYYSGTTVGSMVAGTDGVDLRIRNDRPVKVGGTPVYTAVGGSAGTDTITVAANGFANDASGLPSIARYTLTGPAGSAFRYNAGKLEYSPTPATASTFGAVKFTLGTATLAYAYDVKGNSSGNTTAYTQIADVAAGVAQKPRVYTLDSNVDGWIDGVTVDFRQAVADPTTSLKLMSNPKTGATWDSAISSNRVAHTTTAAVVTGQTTQYTAKLTTVDVPTVKADGTLSAGTTFNNDWNADGTKDATDATLVTESRFNTSVTDDNGAHTLRPFHAALTTGATYSAVYNPTTGAAASLGYYDFLDGEKAVFGDGTAANVDSTTNDTAATGKQIRSYNDGAQPVVLKVNWAQTAAATTKGVDGATITRPATGTLNIFASEDVSLGADGSIPHGRDGATTPLPDEFLLNATPLSLINMGAVMKDAVQSAFGAGSITDVYGAAPDSNTDKISFTNLPSVVGRVLSLTSFADVYQAQLATVISNPAGTVNQSGHVVANTTDLDATVAANGYVASSYKLIVNGTAAANTVVDGGSAFKLASVTTHRVTSGDTLNQIDTLNATFSEAISMPTGQVAADRDGMFIVRALIGERRGASFENRDLVYVFQDFRIPGDKMAYASDGKSITITMPNGNLPNDTVAVYVDYQPATTAEITAGSKKYVTIVSSSAKADADLMGDNIKPFDYNATAIREDYATSTGAMTFDSKVGAVRAANNVINTTNTATANTAGVTVNNHSDLNTALEVLPAYLANQMSSNTSRLYTMTVKGTITNNSTAVLDGTGVAVSLVRLRPGDVDGCATNKRSSSIQQAWVTVKRGPNSSSASADAQTIALANKAVSGADLDRYIAALDKQSKASSALSKAQGENRPGADINKLSLDYDAAVNEVNASKTIYGYVLVTTGTGTDVKDGAATQSTLDSAAEAALQFNHGNNPNATYGRTAVLVKAADLPNRRNGETVYPVSITLPSSVPSSSSPTDLAITGRVDFNHDGAVTGSVSVGTRVATLMAAAGATSELANATKAMVDAGATQAQMRTFLKDYYTAGSINDLDANHVVYNVADYAYGDATPTGAEAYAAAATGVGYDPDGGGPIATQGVTTTAINTAVGNAGAALGAAGDTDLNGVVNGGLNVTWGSLGTTEKRKPVTLELVDRAYAMTDSAGKYRAIVGVPENPIAAAVGASGGALAPTVANDKAANDLFTLVSVLHPTTGKWVQVNSADPAMANFTPFKSDFDSKAAVVVDSELSNVKSFTVKNSGWNLLPFNGVLNRTTQGDVDLARMMITADPTSGGVASGWAWDHGNGEMAFTMGNASAGNVVSLAFQVGKAPGAPTVVVQSDGSTASGTPDDFASDPGAIGRSKINLRDGAGLALQNPDGYDTETSTYRFNACTGGGKGVPANRSLVSKAVNSDFTFTVPFKTGTLAPVLKQGWHLMSLAADTGTSTLAGKGVAAVIWFDSDRKARTWFKGETDIPSTTLTKGTTAFMYEELTTNPTL